MAEDMLSQATKIGGQAYDQAAPIASNIQQGMQVGLQLAARKAQMEQFQIEMQFKRQQMDNQVNEHLANLWDQALKEPDPALQKARVDYAAQVAQQLNKPINPDIVDTLKKSESFRAQVGNYLSTFSDLTDPNQRKQALVMMNSVFGMAPAQAADTLNKITEQQSKEKQAQIFSTGHYRVEQEKGQQARLSKLLPFAVSPQDADSLRRGVDDPNFGAAYARAQQAMNQDTQIKQQREKQEGQAAQMNAQTNQAREKEQERHNRRDEQIGFARVELQKNEAAQKVANEVYSQTKELRQRALEANNVATAFSPNSKTGVVNLQQFQAGVAGLDRLISGTARMAQSVYQGTSYVDWLTRLQNDLSKFSQGGPNTVIPAKTLRYYQGFVADLKKNVDNLNRQTVLGITRNGVQNKVLSAKTAKVLTDGALDPNTNDLWWQSVGVETGAVMQPLPMGQGAQGQTGLRRASPAAIQKLKQKFNGNTAAVIDFMKQQGYDTSGVQ